MISRHYSALLIFILLYPTAASSGPVQVEFNSKDGITISADLYKGHPEKAPFIVLFHRAGWSRGEYLSIVPRLSRMGFNCMAVDQRSGGEVNGVINRTRISAVKSGRATGFLDAEKDMLSSVRFARENHAKGPLILWGSSYSASLVIKIVGEHPGICDGALAFSPGEYFRKSGKGPAFIRNRAGKIRVPIFFTSASTEKSRWWPIYSAVAPRYRTYFLPEKDGAHGSEALWQSTGLRKEYWNAVEHFLAGFLTNPAAR